jgi:hypothetical protein
VTATCTYTHEGVTASATGHDEPLDAWDCPHPSHGDGERCVFHLDPAERDRRGIDDSAVLAAFEDVVAAASRERKRVVGAHLPALDLQYAVLDGENRYPLDLRHATVETLDVSHAAVAQSVNLTGAQVDQFVADGATFEGALTADGVTVGDATAHELVVEGDASFRDATFEGAARFTETAFRDDTSFDGVRFHGDADFRGAEFYGRSNALGDNTAFTGATFDGEAAFSRATFHYVVFDDVTFADDATFEKADVTGDFDAHGASFGALADFDEVTFGADTQFDGVAFHGRADFRGVTFEGGAEVLADDADFEDATFHADADFDHVTFAYTDFAGARFAGVANFEASTFTENASFRDVTFAAETDFDEAIFDGDTSFADASFEGSVDARGAEFRGDANHFATAATFDRAAFSDDADFRNTHFTSASFDGTAVTGVADFADAAFTDRVEFALSAADGEAYVDLTQTTLAAGSVTQPDNHWVHYDLTRATVGRVELGGADPRLELLDYFRICETEFDWFDFSRHRDYLERNDWNLHQFAGSVPSDFAVELTPAAAETTYQKARNAARMQNDRDATIRFSIRKGKARKAKHLDRLRDASLPTGARLGASGAFVGNKLWEWVAGYGYSLKQNVLAFVAIIHLFAFVYAYDHPWTRTTAGEALTFPELFTVDGIATFYYTFLYYSQITGTTVGYGDINPVGPVARAAAMIEGLVAGGIIVALIVTVLTRRQMT